MSATAGADPPADPDGLSDQEYFQAIEETFLYHRGAPLLLSPSDYRMAREWHRAGIPLDVVLRALKEFFEGHAAREDPKRVWGLRQCRPAVEGAWRSLRELTAPGRHGPAAEDSEPLDLERRLGALADSLPEGVPGREELARRIRELGGTAEGSSGLDPQVVEEGLASLEEEAVAAALDGLEPERRAGLEEEAERTLAVLADRVPREEAGKSRERLLRQKVRRAVGLPTLSLFAPEAEEG
ncbi:MAG: hypothetical protein ACLF0P_08275 [Thermoanaerobaculia bacterium]